MKSDKSGECEESRERGECEELDGGSRGIMVLLEPQVHLQKEVAAA